MNAIQLPESYQNPEDLADWLELVAIGSKDQNASAGDLQRELARLNFRNSESIRGNVMIEIDRRELATGKEAYPFLRNATSIELRTSPSQCATYVFCLALSFFKWKNRKGAANNPWLLFEQICAHSAANYLGGEALVFGTGSREGRGSKSVFSKNVTRLAAALGEGEAFRNQKTFSTKDSKLDLVAWKPFDDKRASQVILFGQCAAGADWTGSKLTELNPEVFWDQWMKKGRVSSLLRSVFVPHRVFEDEEWELRARSARLLFDRCRVVAYAHRSVCQTDLDKRLLECCRDEWKLPI
jgi:hypothetical protein